MEMSGGRKMISSKTDEVTSHSRDPRPCYTLLETQVFVSNLDRNITMTDLNGNHGNICRNFVLLTQSSDPRTKTKD